MWRHLAVAALLVLAGCSGVSLVGEDDGERGVVDGVAADEDLDVDASDGLTERELELVTDRTMARVEAIRDLEFRRDVPVSVISRETYRERRSGGGDGEPDRTAEQFWEAAFVVNESTTVGAVRDSVYGSSVLGFFNGSHIVIVTPGDATGQVDVSRATLAHELVHALQAQHFGLRGCTRTTDCRLAAQGITEGDANYVEAIYERRCENGTWDCIPAREDDGGGGSLNLGYFVSVFVPYSDGPTLIQHLRDEGGWDAVNDAYREKPDSTEQVIHPERYGTDPPQRVRIPDRARGEWKRARGPDGRVGRERLGEAVLFAMLWSNGVVPREHLGSDDSSLSPYRYDHPATAGWGGDALVAYTNGSAYGYVLETAWDTPADAGEFHAAYLELLEERGAKEVRDGVYRIPEGDGYADAFHVVRRNDTVVVVNAPTVEDLSSVHRPAEPDGTATPRADEEPALPVPAPGVAVALLAIALAVVLARRRG